MMAFLILLLFILFYLLGKSADLVVLQVKGLGERFGIPLSFLGIILGLLTSVPELSVGINALLENAVAVSVGNLFGGVIVLFGLIYGGGIILNRKTKTDGKIWHIIPFFSYILLAIIFGITGTITEVEGGILMAGYLAFIFFLYLKGEKKQSDHHFKRTPISLTKSVLIVIAGLLGVIVLSKLIVFLSLEFIKDFHIPEFLTGFLVFSIGTNLPEVTITIRSWRKHIKDLSVANIYGSAIANIFIIGLLAFLKPIPIQTGMSYYAMAVAFLVLFILTVFFYKSDKKLTRPEGFALLGFYVLSVGTELILFILGKMG